MVADELPSVPVTDRGALGAVGADGTIASVGAEGNEVPTAFVAVTANVYESPIVKFANEQVVAAMVVHV